VTPERFITNVGEEMKASITFTVKLSDTDSFSIVATGLDQDDEEFLKDIRKLIEKRDEVSKLWHEMMDVRIKDAKT
jgi:chloramphenicol O-acetyltransferase